VQREETEDEARCRQRQRWERAVTVSVLAVIASGILTFTAQENLSFPPRRRVNQTGACIANLKSIDAAKSTWALENHKTNSDVPTDTDLFGPTSYIREKPVCPAGGGYRLRAVDKRPRCSIPAHTI
jgi:hypothetical protein